MPLQEPRHLNSRVGPDAAVLIVTAIALVSYFKGFNSGIQIWGQPYWLIDYSNGLIKRGLVGSIFSFFYDRSDLRRLWGAVLIFHTAISLLLLCTLMIWLRCVLRRDVVAIVISVAAVFATSQFLPTLAYNTGYLDAVMYLLLVIAAASAASGLYGPPVVIGLIGPFIHESFIALWASLALLLLWDRDRNTSKIVVVCTAVLSTAAVWLLHNEPAAIAELNAAPVSVDVREGTLGAIGINVGSRVQYMLSLVAHNISNVIFSIFLYCLPTVVIITNYALCRCLRGRDLAVLVLAAFSPVGILMLGWDLSRFLVPTTMTAFIAVLFMETKNKFERVQYRQFYWAAIGIASFYFFIPFTYAYFNIAYVSDRGFFNFTHTPIGQFFNWYIKTRYSE